MSATKHLIESAALLTIAAYLFVGCTTKNDSVSHKPLVNEDYAKALYAVLVDSYAKNGTKEPVEDFEKLYLRVDSGAFAQIAKLENNNKSILPKLVHFSGPWSFDDDPTFLGQDAALVEFKVSSRTQDRISLIMSIVWNHGFEAIEYEVAPHDNMRIISSRVLVIT